MTKYVIIQSSEKEDYDSEESLVTHWEVDHVIGPFNTREGAQHFMAGMRSFPYTEREVVELHQPEAQGSGFGALMRGVHES